MKTKQELADELVKLSLYAVSSLMDMQVDELHLLYIHFKHRIRVKKLSYRNKLNTISIKNFLNRPLNSKPQ